MDPEAAWNEMIDAIINREQEAAIQFAKSLFEWLGCGGFVPRISLLNITDDWQRYLCQRICTSVINASADLWRSSSEK